MSDIEEDSYAKKKSEVYLAYVDAPIKESDELTISDTFIGSSPLWLHPESIPDENMLKCNSCNSNENMRLLIQAFAPIDSEQMESLQLNCKKIIGKPTLKYISNNDDRVLYVFICDKCPRKLGGVKCIRGVLKHDEGKVSTVDKIVSDQSSMGKKFDINPFDINNNNDTNPFGNVTNSSSINENPFSITSSNNNNSMNSSIEKTNDLQKQPLSKKAQRKLHDEKIDKIHDLQKEYKGFLLYVEQETFQHKPDHLKLPKNLKIEKEALELSDDNVIDTDDLEKDPIKMDPRTEKLSQFLDDEVFQKFQEVVAYNPLQVLRYDLGGKPLYYAATKPVLDTVIPRPEFNKDSQRVFEMQLMPKMIMDLEEGEVSVNDGMEWGSILIFTDVENCIPEFDDNGVGYVEECVRVQWEKRS
ncbi:similar to Saccharomyces cerevisiae YOL022C TSR4 Cytoplasmic protein required for correct processing of the 20S pre-rRNA at site D to generate mature 18S rRNA [Maudiozyma saulgeensis]|uniref:Similar to Saccharomyces cerevisiae YOL022C TSR4 Cytoplasmic protein required for correct processing of the 20S pre-rRNA at site D to generate mature 18S rRNA n=1 Tax=Maudiozyma saulgeensis TaxID=1789683 RepID=A0A1X7QZW1_9SACH|nr:similar to Saccharomyces cerevisiae YOL022C TSR4 Cytoplasmic protein required for correct processing of the 20S pre-rRNA at site D to generate mature 18S rRNA [Kazachstania saulgeensis]